MGLTVEELETLSKAAKVVAKVADGHIGDLYKLDKARDLTDLLEGLQQIAKRVIGLDEKDMQYLSFKEMEEFTNLLHIRSEDFKDLKSTLIIYSCMELAGAIRNRTKSN